MKSLLAVAAVQAAANEVNPIQQVVQMMADLQAKIIKEGEDSQQVFAKFSEWCEDTAKQTKYEIKTAKELSEELKATISKSSADIESLSSQIEDLVAAVSADEKDLKAAEAVRKRENADFVVEEKQLAADVNTIQRAVTILERENGGAASMIQMKNAHSVAEALTAMVQATSLESADASRLTALLQDDDDDSDDDTGAPAASVHDSQSGGVIDTLEDLEEKAQTQLDAAREAETKSLQAFELLKQSLDDKIEFATKELDATKKSLAVAKESKAEAEGDTDINKKDLDEDVVTLQQLHHDCMTKAQDFEEEVKSRGEELKAIATAKKIVIEETSGGAFNQESFLQVKGSDVQTQGDQASQAAHFVRKLAKKEHSAALNQLAQRMASAAKFEADPFAKVKALITDMVAKLEQEAEADATKKAYCDKELAESDKKKTDKTDDLDKLSVKIEKASSSSAQLKNDVARLEKELAELAAAQNEADKIRAEEKALFEQQQAEMQKGIKGVQMALKVLREYYAKEDKGHEDSSGAGGSIIGLLEVVESDFSKGLSELVATEEAAVKEHKAMTDTTQIDIATKTQDGKYKTKEHKSLDKAIAEFTSDTESVKEELSAVTEFIAQLNKECVTKPESYAEKKKRREAEIAGLKDALEIMENEAALIQKGSKRTTLRGQKSHFTLA